MDEKEELKFLEAAFVTLLHSDKYFILCMLGQEKKSTWANVLKIAHDRTADYYRRHEYWNLHKYAELLGI